MTTCWSRWTWFTRRQSANENAFAASRTLVSTAVMSRGSPVSAAGGPFGAVEGPPPELRGGSGMGGGVVASAYTNDGISRGGRLFERESGRYTAILDADGSG